jgi:hypothetical protein
MSLGAISHSPIRTPDWMAIRCQFNETAATALEAILQSLDRVEEQAFAVRGEAMLLIEERNLFRFIMDEEFGDYYQSFDKWLKDTLPRSWGYCRDALRARKECRDVPYEDFAKMKRCNIEQLKKVSSNVRLLPEVIQDAKCLSEKQFVEELNRKHDQHLETAKPMAMASVEDVDEFERAIEMAMVIDECHNRAEAMKAIAINYLDDPGNQLLYERMKAGEQTA